MLRLDQPIWLTALALIALGAAALLLMKQAGRRARPALLFANMPPLLKQGRSWRIWAKRGLIVLDVLVLALLVFCLTRPQRGRNDSVILSEGIDIVLVLDTSGSMAAEDFGRGRTRISHAVDVLKEFVEERQSDRIGLISFAAHPYTRCPMTLDYGLLGGFLDHVLSEWEQAYDSGQRKQAGLLGRKPIFTPQEIDQRSTAIGDALVAAVSRLEQSESRSKIVVLLTDGESNYGETEPLPAADLAAKYGVKVYAVGAGSNRPARVATYDPFGTPVKQSVPFRLDEDTLKSVAGRTGGRYFRAQDRAGLAHVYEEINRLETSEIKTKDYRDWDEIFAPFAWAALALLALHGLLAATVLRTLP